MNTGPENNLSTLYSDVYIVSPGPEAKHRR